MRKKIGIPHNKSDLIPYSSISNYHYASYDDFLRKDKQAQHLIQQGVDLKGLGDFFSDLFGGGSSSDSSGGPLDTMKIAFAQQLIQTIQPSIDAIRLQTIQDIRNQVLAILPIMKQKIESGGTPTSRKLIELIDSKIKSYVPLLSTSSMPNIEGDVLNEETEPLLTLIPNRDVFIDFQAPGLLPNVKVNAGNPRQMALDFYTPELQDSISTNIVVPMEQVIKQQVVEPIENRALLVGTGVFLLGALTTLGGVWAYNKLKSN